MFYNARRRGTTSDCWSGIHAINAEEQTDEQLDIKECDHHNKNQISQGGDFAVHVKNDSSEDHDIEGGLIYIHAGPSEAGDLVVWSQTCVNNVAWGFVAQEHLPNPQ